LQQKRHFLNIIVFILVGVSVFFLSGLVGADDPADAFADAVDASTGPLIVTPKMRLMNQMVGLPLFQLLRVRIWF
jgi:hypothetical protein